MADRQSKNYRVLDLYRRLCEGHVINKQEEAQRFGVDERSIQRDIDDIRAFFSEMLQEGDTREIVYDRTKRGFVLNNYRSPLMTNGEILAVSKILLESRALPKSEMIAVLDKLISGCVPQRSMKLVSELLANETFHYVELTNPARIQDKLWDLGADIHDRRLMELSYLRQDAGKGPVKRIVEPISIIFSDFYFYLIANIVTEEDGCFRHKYSFPAVFRVDRIASYHLRSEHFSLPYADRFQEGEFRKRIQFMYPGPLQTIRFRYTGKSPEAILDRLPTSSIESRDETGVILRAEVYGKGIVMWLLSQGEQVEVLSPKSLRDEITEKLKNMLALYAE